MTEVTSTINTADMLQKLKSDQEKKTRVVRQVEKMEVDPDTGEVFSAVITKEGFSAKEPEYVKVYYNTMMALNGVKNIPADFLLALCAELSGYINDDGTPLTFDASKFHIANLCKKLGIKKQMVNKYIERCVEAGILIENKEFKKVYAVNPWVIARGSWANISKCRLTVDFVEGQWVMTHVETDDAGLTRTQTVKGSSKV